MRVNFITNYFIDANSERQKELDFCIITNACNRLIDSISIIVTEAQFPFLKEVIKENKLDENKFSIFIHEDRPTYNDHFKITAVFTDSINVIANLDIILTPDNAIELKVFYCNKNNKILALSRWDINKEKEIESAVHLNNYWSQDTWVCYGKMKLLPEANFCLGKPGCDNKIAWVLEKNGYEVYNPSIDIKTFHYHITNVRNYKWDNSDTIPGPYLLLTPTKLNNLQRGILYATNV